MLKIIIENEGTALRYIKLKESLNYPTDSILLDNLIDVYISSKATISNNVTVTNPRRDAIQTNKYGDYAPMYPPLNRPDTVISDYMLSDTPNTMQKTNKRLGKNKQ